MNSKVEKEIENIAKCFSELPKSLTSKFFLYSLKDKDKQHGFANSQITQVLMIRTWQSMFRIIEFEGTTIYGTLLNMAIFTTKDLLADDVSFQKTL